MEHTSISAEGSSIRPRSLHWAYIGFGWSEITKFVSTFRGWSIDRSIHSWYIDTSIPRRTLFLVAECRIILDAIGDSRDQPGFRSIDQSQNWCRSTIQGRYRNYPHPGSNINYSNRQIAAWWKLVIRHASPAEEGGFRVTTYYREVICTTKNWILVGKKIRIIQLRDLSPNCAIDHDLYIAAPCIHPGQYY